MKEKEVKYTPMMEQYLEIKKEFRKWRGRGRERAPALPMGPQMTL